MPSHSPFATATLFPSVEPEISSPFDVTDDVSFERWAESKLRALPASVEELMVEVRDPSAMRDFERAALAQSVKRVNFAVYVSNATLSREALLRFGTSIGLSDADHNLCADESKVSVLEVASDAEPGRKRGDYIPYTANALNWHTDGYYNEAADPIRGFLLHCVRNARSGGENEIVDPEMIYLRLRQENPELLAALMRPDAMTVPPNETGGEKIRGERIGPVFSVDPRDGRLLMRFTARKRHIVWADEVLIAARDEILRLIEDEAVPVYRHRLEPNQGIICNNVLHNRSAFTPAEGSRGGRCLYRVRYHDSLKL